MTFFENSFFYALQNKVSRLWAKVTKKSFFVNWFKTYPAQNLQNSLLYRCFCSVFGFFAGVVRRVLKPFLSSGVYRCVHSWYSDFFDTSVRAYGVALLGALLGYCVPLGFGGMGAYRGALFALSLVAVVLVLADKSLKAMFSNSVVSKFVCNLFECDVKSTDATKRCSLPCLVCHLASGLVVGALCALCGNFYVAIIACALIALGALAYDYRIGIFAALVFMPFLPTMAVVALVMASFAFFVLKLMTDKDYKFVHTPLDAPLAVFALVMLISAITSFARSNSIAIFLVYFAFILSYYLTVNAVRTKKQLYALIMAMLFAGVLVALYGIYQHTFGFAEGTTWTDTDMFEDIKTRVVSTFGNPNVLGEYLLLLIPVAAGYVFSKPSAMKKSVALVVAALLSLCMVYTYSRGNWIGLMAAILLFFMFYDGSIVWLGIIAMLFAPLFVPQTIINRLMSVGDTTDTSTSYRVYIWMGTFAMLKDYWISGIGLGTEAFNTIYPFYSYAGIVAPHSHNLYLQIITENGIMGIASFLWLIFTYYKMTISTVIRPYKDKVLKTTSIGLAAGLFGYLLQGMFDNVWYNYRIVFMFYIILALTSCAITMAKKEEHPHD